MSNLSKQIRTYYDSHIMNPSISQSKDAVRLQLEAVFKSELGDSVALIPIGGVINGLGSMTSDMDLSLILPAAQFGVETPWQTKLDMLRRAKRALTKNLSEVVNSSDLRTGVIPILRLKIEGETQEVDINCNDLPSVFDSHLLRYYAKFDWRFPALGMTWTGVGWEARI